MANKLMNKFQSIIQFYLLECPVRTYNKETKEIQGRTEDQPHPQYNFVFRKVSMKGRSFDERGLDGAKLNSLRAAMKRVSNATLESVKAIPEQKAEGEYIYYINNEHVSITEGFFYFIRNAFAHGEYEIENGMYILENHKNGKLKGIGKLKESTLLRWMDLVEMTPEQLKQAGK